MLFTSYSFTYYLHSICTIVIQYILLYNCESFKYNLYVMFISHVGLYLYTFCILFVHYFYTIGVSFIYIYIYHLYPCYLYYVRCCIMDNCFISYSSAPMSVLTVDVQKEQEMSQAKTSIRLSIYASGSGGARGICIVWCRAWPIIRLLSWSTITSRARLS